MTVFRDQRQTAVDNDLWVELYNPGNTSERLNPGSSAKAALLRFNAESGQWERFNSRRNDLGLITVHAPHYNAFALQGDRFRIVLNTERNAYEVRQRYGLRRKATVTEGAGISVGGSGEITFWYNGAITNPAQTATAYYDFGDSASLALNKEVYVSYWPDEQKWYVEAPGGGEFLIGVFEDDVAHQEVEKCRLVAQSGIITAASPPEGLEWVVPDTRIDVLNMTKILLYGGDVTQPTPINEPLIAIRKPAHWDMPAAFPDQIEQCLRPAEAIDMGGV